MLYFGSFFHLEMKHHLLYCKPTKSCRIFYSHICLHISFNGSLHQAVVNKGTGLKFWLVGLVSSSSITSRCSPTCSWHPIEHIQKAPATWILNQFLKCASLVINPDRSMGLNFFFQQARQALIKNKCICELFSLSVQETASWYISSYKHYSDCLKSCFRSFFSLWWFHIERNEIL